MREPSQRHNSCKRLGRYELLEELSRGRDSVLYKARDPLLGRLVAIKTVEPDAAGSERPDFERTVGLAAGLAHPNIVTVYDAATNRDGAYIATELVDGETLRDVLDSGVALSPITIERIAAQIADGLDFMHRHAVVHGDVNPSTVLVLDIGFVKLSYLGNALFPMGRSMSMDGICATSSYVAPERALGRAIDGRSDVFSLGVVLYEMLTGVVPFSGSTVPELIDAIRNKHPETPSALNSSIPTGFDYVVARALAKDPAHRYQTAAEMASHLRRWALEESTFFVTPRRAAMNVPATVPLSNAAALPARARDSLPAVRTRRHWLMYGVPGALIAMGAAWTLRPRQAATAASTDSVAAAIPDTPAPPGVELVPVRDDSPPATAQIEDEPVTAAAPERASAHTNRRPVARLRLAVSPWGEIYVDGRRRGVSPPLTEIDLAPGTHRIEIRNTVFPSRRESVEVRPNGRLRIKHKFR